MGFYGNITNTSKTNFVFDKIYTNRKAMDNNIDKDGIFIGRYVLVEYGEITEDSFIRAYGPQTDGYYHISNDNEVTTRILYTTEPIPSKDNYIKKGQIIYILGIGGKYEFLECNGGVNKGKPSFSDNPGLDPKTDPYFYNLKQDQAEYNVSRGYDGTVWIKTSVNNEIKYVNIAELNSVVPSFEMVADAPTMSPILPHFDTASNNVYYKLHWQPAWGMRIAETTDGSDKFSDYITSWSQEVYNKETGEIFTQWYFPNALQEDGKTKGVWRALNAEEQPPTINADIYFNHAAFDSQIGETNINKTIETNKAIYKPITLTAETYKRNKYYYKTGNRYYLDGRAFNTNRTYYEKLENYIGITADGISGNKYNLHDGTSNTKQQVDTQQIHINLPAIGNMMSEAWDIIHGEKRDNIRTDEDGGSLQGRLDSFMAFYDNQIPVKNENGTIVGSKINGAQPYDNDWEEKPIEVLYDNTEPGFERDDAWIKTEINTNGLKTGDKGGSNDQVDNSGISIHHTFHSTKDTKATLDKNSGTQTLTHIDNTTVDENKKDKIPILNKSDKETGKEDTIKLYTPYVDAKGHVIGKNIETITLPYGYKTITTNGLADDVTNADLDSSSGGQTIADNTQDSLAINTKNKWLQIEVTNDKVELAHEIHSITTTSNGTSNANSEGGATDENNINIPDWKYDNAGHITEKRDHYYTLPFGFKTIQTANSSGSGEAPAAKNTSSTYNTNTTEHVADTTQDTLKFAATNKWITMQADTSDDVVKFGHVLSPETVKEHKSTDTSVATFGDSFNVLNFDTDEAGHITRVGQTTITTPAGSLEDTASSNTANVLTSIKFTPSTGKIETTHQDAGTLKLGTAYIANKNGALTFDGGNTINDALSAIQTHINESEYTESGTQYFIDSITQVDGKITTTRKGTAGTLIVGENTTNNLIGENDSVNKAFDTIDKALAKEKTDREAADTTEKNARIAAINAEQAARESADNTEKAAREAAIAQEVIDRDKAIDDAIAELVDSAPDNLNTLREIVEWIDADKDGAIDLAANVAKNATDINTLNTKLKSAAYETKETFVLKTEYNAMVASFTQTINDLTNRIIALEKKMETNHPTETPTPEEGETI